MSGVLSALSLVAALAWAEPSTVVDAMRGQVPIVETTRAPALRNAVNDDVRRPRNYDWQPPTIPHRVDGYQIDKNFNKCLDCHAREKTEFSQASPVSETHYIDRSGKVLNHVSTRRYFCMQCHVAQEPVRPLVGNSFENLGTAIRKPTEPPRAKP
ncbi:MAG TPA: nitrate reductase cytochrome c-type subunit [Burkholderiaceae bacterium]|nr:nitrate reductase cytochrome c-type subunit [Burkholderiaceae bacterium]